MNAESLSTDTVRKNIRQGAALVTRSQTEQNAARPLVMGGRTVVLPSSEQTKLLHVVIFGTHGASIQGLQSFIEEQGQPIAMRTLEHQLLLEYVRTNHVDVVVFDLYHRGLFEFELASRIRRISRSTNILFLIDEPSLDELKLSLRHGVLGVLRKKSPKLGSLAQIIRVVSCGGTVIAPALLTALVDSLPGDVLCASAGEEISPAQLAPVDREILGRLACGESTKQIADCCGFSHGVIRNRLTRIYRLLGIRNQAQAVAFAVRNGLDRP